MSSGKGSLESRACKDSEYVINTTMGISDLHLLKSRAYAKNRHWIDEVLPLENEMKSTVGRKPPGQMPIIDTPTRLKETHQWG